MNGAAVLVVDDAAKVRGGLTCLLKTAIARVWTPAHANATRLPSAKRSDSSRCLNKQSRSGQFCRLSTELRSGVQKPRRRPRRQCFLKESHHAVHHRRPIDKQLINLSHPLFPERASVQPSSDSSGGEQDHGCYTGKPLLTEAHQCHTGSFLTLPVLDKY